MRAVGQWKDLEQAAPVNKGGRSGVAGSETPEALLQDQPRGALAARKMEIKCEPASGR